ncbi:MAG: cell cycle transcriptional regulator TrcR [Pseudomonadota bacterium]
MTTPLMPRATAIWLIDNTALTFEQIADFCGLHLLEVNTIADGESTSGLTGLDPIAGGQLTQEEIDRCSAEPSTRLVLREDDLPKPASWTKGPRYTPVSRRSDKPAAIAWLIKHYPDMTDAAISRLVGTTKPTIKAVRERTHHNIQNITPQNPVLLGLAHQQDFDKAVAPFTRQVEENPAEEISAENVPADPAALQPNGLAINE